MLFALAFWKTHLRAQAVVSNSIHCLNGLCEDVQWVVKDLAMKLREEAKNKKRNMDNAQDELSYKNFEGYPVYLENQILLNVIKFIFSVRPRKYHIYWKVDIYISCLQWVMPT